MGVISVSSKGQIVIPKDIRDKMGIKEGTKLLVRVKDDVIEVRPVKGVSWMKWRGCLAGSDVLEELVEEHRREVEKDEKDPGRMGDSLVVEG